MAVTCQPLYLMSLEDPCVVANKQCSEVIQETNWDGGCSQLVVCFSLKPQLPQESPALSRNVAEYESLHCREVTDYFHPNHEYALKEPSVDTEEELPEASQWLKSDGRQYSLADDAQVIFSPSEVAQFMTRCHQHVNKPLMRRSLYGLPAAHGTFEDMEKDLQSECSGKQAENVEELVVEANKQCSEVSQETNWDEGCSQLVFCFSLKPQLLQESPALSSDCPEYELLHRREATDYFHPNREYALKEPSVDVEEELTEASQWFKPNRRQCSLADDAQVISSPYLQVGEELLNLFSDYGKLKIFIEAKEKHLLKHSHPCYHKVPKAVYVQASKVLDVGELRKQKHTLHDPELLQQLSLYEEDSLKPFIVRYLDKCREGGIQPDSFQPDLLLSPLTPAGQVLGFILTRKECYIKDLQIDRKHFSSWDVDTPPTAQAPPYLESAEFRLHLEDLYNLYDALFDEVETNLETLSHDRHYELRGVLEYQVPFSRWDACDHLHHTPLFAPLCTILLWKVIQFLVSHNAGNLSSKLRDYEKRLATFVKHFLLACHQEGVVAPTGDVSLNEDECDQNDPTHFLAYLLTLKPYYVGSLCIDESLFTLQTERSLQDERREENGWMDTSQFEPTPCTSENESSSEIPVATATSGLFVPPQPKEKGKCGVDTFTSTVSFKLSAPGEDGNGEDDGEDTTAERRQVGNHMTSHMTIPAEDGIPNPQGDHSNALPLCPEPAISNHPAVEAAYHNVGMCPPPWRPPVSVQFQESGVAGLAQPPSDTATTYFADLCPQYDLLSQPLLGWYTYSPLVAAPNVSCYYLVPAQSAEDVHPSFPSMVVLETECSLQSDVTSSGITGHRSELTNGKNKRVSPMLKVLKECPNPRKHFDPNKFLEALQLDSLLPRKEVDTSLYVTNRPKLEQMYPYLLEGQKDAVADVETAAEVNLRTYESPVTGKGAFPLQLISETYEIVTGKGEFLFQQFLESENGELVFPEVHPFSEATHYSTSRSHPTAGNFTKSLIDWSTQGKDGAITTCLPETRPESKPYPFPKDIQPQYEPQEVASNGRREKLPKCSKTSKPPHETVDISGTNEARQATDRNCVAATTWSKKKTGTSGAGFPKDLILPPSNVSDVEPVPQPDSYQYGPSGDVSPGRPAKKESSLSKKTRAEPRPPNESFTTNVASATAPLPGQRMPAVGSEEPAKVGIVQPAVKSIQSPRPAQASDLGYGTGTGSSSRKKDVDNVDDVGTPEGVAVEVATRSQCSAEPTFAHTSAADAYKDEQYCMGHISLNPQPNTVHRSELTNGKIKSVSPMLKVLKECPNPRKYFDPVKFLEALQLDSLLPRKEVDTSLYVTNGARLEQMYPYLPQGQKEKDAVAGVVYSTLKYTVSEEEEASAVRDKFAVNLRIGWNALKDCLAIRYVNVERLAQKLLPRESIAEWTTKKDNWQGIMEELRYFLKLKAERELTRPRVVHALHVTDGDVEFINNVMSAGLFVSSDNPTLPEIQEFLSGFQEPVVFDKIFTEIVESLKVAGEWGVANELQERGATKSNPMHLFGVWLATAAATTRPATWADFVQLLRKAGVDEGVVQIVPGGPWDSHQSDESHISVGQQPLVTVHGNAGQQSSHTSCPVGCMAVAGTPSINRKRRERDRVREKRQREEKHYQSLPLDLSNAKSILYHAKAVYLTLDYNNTRRIPDILAHHWLIDDEAKEVNYIGIEVAKRVSLIMEALPLDEPDRKNKVEAAYRDKIKAWCSLGNLFQNMAHDCAFAHEAAQTLRKAYKCYDEVIVLSCDDTTMYTAYQNRASVYITLAAKVNEGVGEWDEVPEDIVAEEPREAISIQLPVEEQTKEVENFRCQHMVLPSGRTLPRGGLDVSEEYFKGKDDGPSRSEVLSGAGSSVPFAGGPPPPQGSSTRLGTSHTHYLRHRKFYLRKAEEDLRKVANFVEDRLAKVKGKEDSNSLALSIFEANSKAFYDLQKVLVCLGHSQEALKIAEANRARNLGEVMLSAKKDSIFSLSDVKVPLDLSTIWSFANSEQTPVAVLSCDVSCILVHIIVPRDEQSSLVPVGGYRRQQTPASDLTRGSEEAIPANCYHLYKIELFTDTFTDEWSRNREARPSSDNVTFEQYVIRNLMDFLNCMNHTPLEPVDFEPRDNPLTVLFDQFARKFAEVIEDKAPKFHELVVIADKALHLLPWPVLQDKTSRKFLGDRYRIRTYPSILTMGVISSQPVPVITLPLEKHFPSEERFLVVGNPAIPKFITQKKEVSLGRLPHAEDEATQVSHILETKPLLREQATKQTVIYRLQMANLVHIATHGSGSQGYIALASNMPVLSSTNAVDAKECLLFIDEIQRLHISASLVVLSACDSARGEIVNEGVNSVARAILAAGAQSVLVSLVRVPDKSASIFMRLFYRFLVHDGMTTSEALQKSSMGVRCIKSLSQHVHWGGFQLIGRNIQIIYNNASNSAKVATLVGDPTPFPRLELLQQLEKAIFRNDRNPPRDVVLVKGLSFNDPAEVVRDFICKHFKHYPGGVFWYNAASEDLLDASVSFVKQTVPHLKTIQREPPVEKAIPDKKKTLLDGSGGESYDNHYRLIVLDHPASMASCLAKIPEIHSSHSDIIVIHTADTDRDQSLTRWVDEQLVRGCTPIVAGPLDKYDSIQRMAYSILRNSHITPYEEDYEAFDVLQKFCNGSSSLVRLLEGMLCKEEAEMELRQLASDISLMQDMEPNVITRPGQHDRPAAEKKTSSLFKRSSKRNDRAKGEEKGSNACIRDTTELTAEDHVHLSNDHEKPARHFFPIGTLFESRMTQEEHFLVTALGYLTLYPKSHSEGTFTFTDQFLNQLATFITDASGRTTEPHFLVNNLAERHVIRQYPLPVLSPPDYESTFKLFYVPDSIVRAVTFDLDQADEAFILTACCSAVQHLSELHSYHSYHSALKKKVAVLYAESGLPSLQQ